MEGKEAIIAKIRAEAENNASRIVQDAEDNLSAQIRLAKEQADKLSEQKAKAVKAECEAVILRAETIAKLECRKKTLEKKQALLSEVYSLAQQKLLANEKEYREFCASVIKANAEEGDEVVVGELDAKILDAKWLKTIAPTLTLSKETHGERGIILIGENARKVFTLPVLFDLAREKTESKVAGILFGENK